MLGLLLTGLGITGIVLFSSKKDDDGGEPQAKGETKKTPPPPPGNPPPVFGSDTTNVIKAGSTVHLRTHNKILDPEGAGAFLMREDRAGEYRTAKDTELVGDGWSVLAPDREYVVRPLKPGNYKIQLMEEPSFRSVFLDAWYLEVQ